MKKATIILGIVVIAMMAGVFMVKSGYNAGSNTAIATPTPTPNAGTPSWGMSDPT